MANPISRMALVATVLLLTVASAQAADDASAAFLQGEKLLAAGDLKDALKQYGVAVKLEGDNQEYVQQYLMVRQVVMLQSALAKETNPQRWEQTALALRTFFGAQRLHDQALTIDQAMWDRSKTSDNAIQLADTLLALDKSAEAAQLLTGLSPQQRTGASQSLLAVSLARQGKLDEAKSLAGRIPAASQADPGALFMVARMHAAIGDNDRALAALKRSYEAVPPSRLDALKSLTRECKDFAELTSLASFSAVMKTTSKVVESKCSGGSSCASCPMRGKCAGGGK